MSCNTAFPAIGRRTATGLVAAGIGLAFAAPASANHVALAMPSAMVPTMQQSCVARALSPAAPQAATKAGAILGEQMSALDRIRAQQASMAAPAPDLSVETPATSCSYAPIAALAPAIEITAVAAPAPLLAQANGDDYLATTRVRIGFTQFNGDWSRVSAARLGQRRTRQLLRAAPGENLLAQVNSFVNTRIAHVEDRDQYARGDYWATAAETLGSGRGDCEDFAILKMQMLAAMGVARDDMYLTLARDLARGADHAVLIVRRGDGWHMLDNATDVVLPANEQSYDYRPMFSYSGDASYLHGFTDTGAETRLAYLSVSD